MSKYIFKSAPATVLPTCTISGVILSPFTNDETETTGATPVKNL